MLAERDSLDQFVVESTLLPASSNTIPDELRVPAVASGARTLETSTSKIPRWQPSASQVLPPPILHVSLCLDSSQPLKSRFPSRPLAYL